MMRKRDEAMKKLIIKIILGLFATAIVIYIALLVSTNGLMKEVKSVFLGNIDILETEGKPIDRYNIDKYLINKELGDVKLSIVRIFTLHNFSDGYIWIRYTFEAKDTVGKVITGSYNIPAKWKIHKRAGKWEIAEIYEAP